MGRSLVSLSVLSRGHQSWAQSAVACRGGGFSSCRWVQTASTVDGENHTHQEERRGPLYPDHIPTSAFQKLLLGLGSAVAALLDPRRADMVAVNGETSGRWYAHRRMLTRMKVDPEGKLVLRDQPRINSKTVDLDALRRLPKNTLGFAYTRFLDVNKVTPDSRLPVRFVDDPELAYVMQRYRETHDLVHTVLGMRTNMQGEVAVKWVEGIQTGLPMCLGGALLAPLRYNPRQRENYVTRYLEWALKNGFKSRFLLAAYFEKRWDQDLDEFRREFRIDPLPNIAATQKKQK